jgi:transcription initiation factor TFIIIB Brf1 subunit/transcription initiation factor TFIIB
MENVADVLKLSGRTVRLAQTFYEISKETHTHDPDQRALACLYLAAKEHSYNIGLMEFADAASYPTGELSAAVRAIREDLFSMLERRPPGTFVDEFIAKLNTEFGTNLGHDVNKAALHIIYNDSGEQSAIAVAAGAIYIAAQREGKRLSHQDIADVAEIDEKAVRHAINDLAKD